MRAALDLPYDRVRGVVRYLVTKRLAGDVRVLLAVKEAVVDWRSPSEVGRKFGMSKYMVRGYVQRVEEKAGGHRLATLIVERAWREIYRLEPVVVRVGCCWVCLICNEVIAESPLVHIRRYHSELVEQAVDTVLERAFNGGRR